MQPQQKSISLDQTTGILCENCEGQVFAEGLFLRKVSRFLTGETKDSLIPQPTFYCVKCGHVNKSFDITQQQSQEDES